VIAEVLYKASHGEAPSVVHRATSVLVITDGR